MEAAILSLVDSPSRRSEVAARALAKLQCNHSWERNAQRIIDAAGLADRLSGDA